MTTKVITVNCKNCEKYFKIQDDGSMTCSWGQVKKPKRLIDPKGKQTIVCNLTR